MINTPVSARLSARLSAPMVMLRCTIVLPSQANLTNSIIGRMIDRMCKRLLAALLILGWVSLSIFDVIEDLDEVPGQAAVSSAPNNDSSSSKRGGWGPLANNIVESANRINDRDVVAPVTFTPAQTLPRLFDLACGFLSTISFYARNSLARVLLISVSAGSIQLYLKGTYRWKIFLSG
jgi:hypothetical protein